jgi:putative endonuclease
MQVATTAKGKLAEDFAIDYLVRCNLRFLSRNFYSPFGELDLIMWDLQSHELVFVEVKGRSDAVDPIVNISRRKVTRIYRSIDYFLLQFPQFAANAYRVDFVGVTLAVSPSAYWLANLEVDWE